MIKGNNQKLTALIACSDEWMCRSLQTVFEEKGYSATRVLSGKKALKLARKGGFDVILLEERLDELSAVDVAVALRDDPLFDHATPIVITSSAHASPQSRLAAYGAGAWEYCHQPLDVDALFLKLHTFLRARQELAAAQAQSLMDPETGLYTPIGLQHLAGQLGARALRRHEAFACVAFTPQPRDGKDSPAPGDRMAFADVAHVMREQSRKSDVLAQTGEFRFAILAPDTDDAGARLLVARMQRELDHATKMTSLSGAFDLRAGYCAVSDLAASKVDLTELVHRAESALERVGAGGSQATIVSFDDLAPSGEFQTPPPAAQP
ncbi:MAG TPA: response regulator [Gemmatimonadaceae bacterium]